MSLQLFFKPIMPPETYASKQGKQFFQNYNSVKNWVNKNRIPNYVLKRSVRNHIDTERGFKTHKNMLIYAHKDFFKKYTDKLDTRLDVNYEMARVKHYDYKEPFDGDQPPFEKLVVLLFADDFKRKVIEKYGDIEYWETYEHEEYIKARQKAIIKSKMPSGAVYMEGIMNQMESVMMQNREKDLAYSALLEKFNDLSTRLDNIENKKGKK